MNQDRYMERDRELPTLTRRLCQIGLRLFIGYGQTR